MESQRDSLATDRLPQIGARHPGFRALPFMSRQIVRQLQALRLLPRSFTACNRQIRQLQDDTDGAPMNSSKQAVIVAASEHRIRSIDITHPVSYTHLTLPAN